MKLRPKLELTIAYCDAMKARLALAEGDRSSVDAAARAACAERILRDKLWQHREAVLGLILDTIA